MAATLSGVFPGLGQFYNREWLKALPLLVGGGLTGFWPLSPLDVDIDPDDLTAGLLKLLVWSTPFLSIALWSVFDAYRTAQLANQQRSRSHPRTLRSDRAKDAVRRRRSRH